MIPLSAESDGVERRFPWMNFSLIVANFLVFFYELSLSDTGFNNFINAWSIVPCEYATHCAAYAGTPHPFFITLFTSMFIHGSWEHILGNMLFLYVFGNQIDRSMGAWRYLVFYLLCGMGANALEIATATTSSVPGLGASGAIAGVLAAYLVLYPNARIGTVLPISIVFIPARMPAWVFIVGWFMIQLLSAVGAPADASGGGVAYFAHVGGFITGLLLVRLFVQEPRVRQLRNYHYSPFS